MGGQLQGNCYICFSIVELCKFACFPGYMLHYLYYEATYLLKISSSSCYTHGHTCCNLPGVGNNCKNLQVL